MKIRCYDPNGKERWMAVGVKIPVGWYDSDCNLITTEKTVMLGEKTSGLYNESRVKSTYYAYLK